MKKVRIYALSISQSTLLRGILPRHIASLAVLCTGLAIATPSQAFDIGGFFKKLDQDIQSAIGNDQTKEELATNEDKDSSVETGPAGESDSATMAPQSKPIAMYGLSLEQNREIQQLLATLGYAPGPADGFPGKNTQAAIQTFQQDLGSHVDGLPSLQLLEQLTTAADRQQGKSLQASVDKVIAKHEAGEQASQLTRDANSSITPNDLRYSSVADAKNYADYRKKFDKKQIDQIVQSVETGRSLALNRYTLAAFIRLYDQETLVAADVLDRVMEGVTGKSDDTAVIERMFKMMNRLSVDNALTIQDVRLLNDGRNSNQPNTEKIDNMTQSRGWELLPAHEAAFHMLGYKSGTIRKYVHRNGQEHVFQLRNGQWVFINDGVNTGTFNYSSESTPHFILDITPWILWGIGAEDQLTRQQRLIIAKEQFKPFISASIVQLLKQESASTQALEEKRQFDKPLLQQATTNTQPMVKASSSVKTERPAATPKDKLPLKPVKKQLHKASGMKFYLPPGAIAMQATKCNRSIVGQISEAKIKDMRQWACLGYVEQGNSKIILLRNREKSSRSYGVPSWLFKVVKSTPNRKVTNLGDVRAKDGLVPVKTAKGEIEILGLTKAGWSGNASDEPYARYRVDGTLKRISQGPKVAALFDNPVPSRSGRGGASLGAHQAPIGPGNLSDEFYINKIKAISKYSKWQKAPFKFSSVSFSNSNFLVKYTEIPTSFERAHNRRMGEMNQGKNYWGNWFDMTSGKNPRSQTWTLVCIFPATEGDKMAGVAKGSISAVQLKIKDARDRNLVFDCKL